MNGWRRLSDDEIQVRGATPGDRPLVSALLANSRRRQGVLAIEEQVAALAGGLSALAFWRKEPVGFLGLTAREPDEDPIGGWMDVTISVVADGFEAGPFLRRLIDPVRTAVPVDSEMRICALAAEEWLHEALVASGFAEVDRVISYLRRDLPVPAIPATPARLRALLPSDTNTVLDLNTAAFEPMWRYDATRILSWVLTADHAVLAEEGGHPVGFGLTTSQTLTDYAQLIRLAIYPAMQGLGIGRQLVIDAIAYARQSAAKGLMLNTQASNVAARRMYGALGFEELAPDVPVMVCRL